MLHVVSKGVLLESSKVYFNGDNNEDNDLTTVMYTIKTSFKNSPVTEVLAYYIGTDGNFITGNAFISFEDDLPNYVRDFVHY